MAKQVGYMNARALRALVDDVLAHAGGDTLIIDLRELEAIDSTGLGLLARVGRTTLERGRRSVIVCSVRDVITCLRAVSFDTMFLIVEAWPFASDGNMVEVPLREQEPLWDVGRCILEAHRDLANLSDENRRAFAGVISALAAELDTPMNPGGS
jgi:anti-anti-sigma factor